MLTKIMGNVAAIVLCFAVSGLSLAKEQMKKPAPLMPKPTAGQLTPMKPATPPTPPAQPAGAIKTGHENTMGDMTDVSLFSLADRCGPGAYWNGRRCEARGHCAPGTHWNGWGCVR